MLGFLLQAGKTDAAIGQRGLEVAGAIFEGAQVAGLVLQLDRRLLALSACFIKPADDIVAFRSASRLLLEQDLKLVADGLKTLDGGLGFARNHLAFALFLGHGTLGLGLNPPCGGEGVTQGVPCGACFSKRGFGLAQLAVQFGGLAAYFVECVGACQRIGNRFIGHPQLSRAAAAH